MNSQYYDLTNILQHQSLSHYRKKCYGIQIRDLLPLPLEGEVLNFFSRMRNRNRDHTNNTHTSYNLIKL